MQSEYEYVRLAELEIEPAQLDNYKAATKEHFETAILRKNSSKRFRTQGVP
jgi:hypothetical protein